MSRSIRMNFVLVGIFVVILFASGLKACDVTYASGVYGTTHTTHTTHITPSKPAQPKAESFKPNPFWKWFLGK